MTIANAEPETQSPDYLAGSVLRSFNRPVGVDQPWGLGKTIILSLVTFGFGPLFIWPRRTRDLIHAERGQFEHLAEWMRQRCGPARVAKLTLASDRIRPNFVLTYLPVLIALLTIGAMFFRWDDAGNPRGVWWASTFGWGKTNRGPVWLLDELFTVWTTGLFLAYGVHWMQLMLHTAKVRRFVAEFNQITAADGLPPVPEPRGLGFRPAWFIAGILMIPTLAASWAVPMMLCGAKLRRYRTVSLPVIRMHLADRVRDLLVVHRPAMRMPQQVTVPRWCSNEKCRAKMDAVANFCPRCGTHVGPEVNAIA